MSTEFHHRRRVEFNETDAAGIMHFSNYFRFMESVEHAFFRSLGLSAHGTIEGRSLAWPRVSVTCDYSRPLRFEDEVDLHLTVRERRSKSVTYEIVFRRCEGGVPAEEVARGTMAVVCTEIVPGAPMKAVAIPPSLAALLVPVDPA